MTTASRFTAQHFPNIHAHHHDIDLMLTANLCHIRGVNQAVRQIDFDAPRAPNQEQSCRW